MKVLCQYFDRYQNELPKFATFDLPVETLTKEAALDALVMFGQIEQDEDDDVDLVKAKKAFLRYGRSRIGSRSFKYGVTQKKKVVVFWGEEADWVITEL